jgi:hypothetical protein
MTIAHLYIAGCILVASLDIYLANLVWHKYIALQEEPEEQDEDWEE